jgi:hypothetical protein
LNIETYISSGILESYVLGLATSEEIAELERMRLQYPDLDIAIKACEYEMEKNIRLMDAPPPPEELKRRIMQQLHYTLELEDAKDKYKSNQIHYNHIILPNNNNKIRVAIGWKIAFISMLVMTALSLLAAIVMFFLLQES